MLLHACLVPHGSLGNFRLKMPGTCCTTGLPAQNGALIPLVREWLLRSGALMVSPLLQQQPQGAS